MPITLANSDELDHIKKLSPDVVVVVAYGQILPVDFFKPRKNKFFECPCVFAAKMERSCSNSESDNEQGSRTGISIMKIIEKLDAGPVLLKSKIKIKRE